MSAAQLRLDDRAWSGGVTGDLPAEPWPTIQSRAERLLPLVAGACLVAVDTALVVGAFLLAHWVRFIVPDNEAVSLGLDQYLRMGFTVSVASVALLAWHGFYDEERPQAWPGRLRTVVSAISTSLVLAVALSFFLGDQRFSRLWYGAGWLFAVAGLMGWRTVAHRGYTAIRDHLGHARRVLIVGANRVGRELASELPSGYRVVGFVDNGSDLEASAGVSLLGPIAQLEQFVQMHAVDELIVALPADRREQVGRMVARGFRRRVKVKILPDLGVSSLWPRELEVHHLGGRPYLGFASVARVSWFKRATDLVFTTVGLLAVSPLLLAVALAVKLDSPGPVFYRQQRVGKDGRRFWMLKFRSMRQDADRLLAELKAKNEAVGPLFKMRQDPRVTRVGRVLRRLSLDELPQLFNVLKGEMSLVGPRPPLPSEVAEYEDWQFGRLRAVPGITGLWQVSGRSEVPFRDMVRLDLHYIRSWSFGLDVEILLRTVPAVLSSRGAY